MSDESKYPKGAKVLVVAEVVENRDRSNLHLVIGQVVEACEPVGDGPDFRVVRPGRDVLVSEADLDLAVPGPGPATAETPPTPPPPAPPAVEPKSSAGSGPGGAAGSGPGGAAGSGS